jgi:hypothetical protein
VEALTDELNNSARHNKELSIAMATRWDQMDAEKARAVAVRPHGGMESSRVGWPSTRSLRSRMGAV